MGLIYNVFLPSPADSDVVKRVLKVSVDGVETSIGVAVGVDKYTLPPIKEGSAVLISLQDEDDAGNKSDWSSPLSFIATDTIVPSTPGAVSVKLVAEVADPVEPPPAPPVVDVAQPVVAPEPEPPTKLEENIDLPPPSE